MFAIPKLLSIKSVFFFKLSHNIYDQIIVMGRIMHVQKMYRGIVKIQSAEESER